MGKVVKHAEPPRPPVLVRGRGLLGTIVTGLFATVCVTIVSVSLVLIYGMSIVNHRLQDFMTASPELLTQVRQWRDALPPALSDALNDERSPEYRQQLQLKASLAGDKYAPGTRRPIVEIENVGERTVTLMTLRVVVRNEEGMPIREYSEYVATPFAVDSDWRGPMMPGSARTITFAPVFDAEQHDVQVEVVELRVWCEDAASPVPAIPSHVIPSEALEGDTAAADRPSRLELPPAPTGMASRVYLTD